MSLWVCAGCSTAYAVGSPACPHCGSVARTEEDGRGLVPCVEVACGNADCAAHQVVRRVYLRRPAPGVVEQPGVLACEACGTRLVVEDGGE